MVTVAVRIYCNIKRYSQCFVYFFLSIFLSMVKMAA